MRAAALALLVLGAGAHPPSEGPGIRPAAQEKCPVCGMFVARYPDWVAGVRFRDGGQAVFDGAKDLFKFLLGGYRDARGHGATDVTETFVTDYYGVRQVDARAAWFVLGGDVLGPMGKELVPFAAEADAREFLGDHHGTRLLRFAEVTPAILKELE